MSTHRSILLLALLVPAAHAQRIEPDDLVHEGAFRLPGPSGGSNWEYSGMAMAFRPGAERGSLFGVGHDHHQQVSEIAIPTPVAARRVDDLPVARTLQPFADVTGGMFGPLEIARPGLAFLNDPDRLHFTWGQHFQDLQATHGWCDPDLTRPNPAGPWRIGDYSNYATADYLFEIPDDWAARHTPGLRLATGRFRDGRWGGLGPALLAIGPWQDGSPPAPGATLRSIQPLLLYGVQEPGEVEITTDPSRAMSCYAAPDEWTGGAWLTAGQRSAVVLVGTKAIGRTWYGFSNGVEWPIDIDESTVYPDVPPWPDDQRGWWAERYEAWLLFFDPADLAEVAAGRMATWAPQPYAHLALDRHLLDGAVDTRRGKRLLVGACAFDRQRGRLYVFERQADGDRSVVHAFRVE